LTRQENIKGEQTMKKIIAIFVSALLLLTLPATAFAHGHGGHGGTQTARYSVCDATSCAQAGLHYHSDKAYAAHYYGGGHDYHLSRHGGAGCR
jgi:hypothetical protein